MFCNYTKLTGLKFYACVMSGTKLEASEADAAEVAEMADVSNGLASPVKVGY